MSYIPKCTCSLLFCSLIFLSYMYVATISHFVSTDREEPWLSRRDVDLYLSTIYSHLMKSLPELNMVILLGDIFSDGFQATHSQWKDYLNVNKCS